MRDMLLFVAGMVVGGTVGLVLAACCTAAKRGQERLVPLRPRAVERMRERGAL